MASAIRSSAGKVRKARKIPPTPSVSPIVCRSPNRSGTSKSTSVAACPPTAIALMQKSAPSTASLRSGCAVTVGDAPTCDAMRAATAVAVSSRSASMSCSLMRAVLSSPMDKMSCSRSRVNSTLPAPMNVITGASWRGMRAVNTGAVRPAPNEQCRMRVLLTRRLGVSKLVRMAARALRRPDRITQILARLDATGTVDVAELADLFGVSLATIRRDLQLLEEQRLVERTHGGAIALDAVPELPVRYRTSHQLSEKQAIARLAVSRIPLGAVVG